jgi:acetyl esterase/lipase
MMAVLRAGASTPIAGTVAIAMPSDLESLVGSLPSIPAGIRDLVASSPWADMLGAVVRELSPVSHVHAEMPPALLIHGTEDRVVPFAQSEKFCRAARQVGARCELQPVHGAGHGIRWWNDARWISRMVAWLEGLGAPAASKKSPAVLPAGSRR